MAIKLYGSLSLGSVDGDWIKQFYDHAAKQGMSWRAWALRALRERMEAEQKEAAQ